MPLEESSPLMFLVLVSLMFIFHPTQSNSYSFINMSQMGPSGIRQEFPKISPSWPAAAPSRTIMHGYVKSDFLHVRNPAADSRECYAFNQNHSPQNYHNATRMRTYLCSLSRPDRTEYISISRQADYPATDGLQGYAHEFRGDQESGVDISGPENPADTADLNHRPAPLYSWLIGASIFGLMGFSRKPC